MCPPSPASPSPPPRWRWALPDADEILRNAGLREQLGLGVAGYCAGVALRTAGTFGLARRRVFLALQGLQYKGYISVDWHRVEREMVGALDVDGDGTLTDVDARAHWTGFASRWGDVTDVLSFDSRAALPLLCHGVGGPVGRALRWAPRGPRDPPSQLRTRGPTRTNLDEPSPSVPRELPGRCPGDSTSAWGR